MDSNMRIESMSSSSSCCWPSSSLSEDLLIQILVYLPVRSLLRFKSISKSWLALIENSDFIHLHLTTLPPNKFATFIFQAVMKPYSEKEGSNIFMLSGDEDNETFVDLSMPTLTFDDDDDCGRGRGDFRLLLGSCNGIVCLHNEKNNSVTLWNPATKQFRLVPESLTVATVFGKKYNDFIAFGFDVNTKDYKVVFGKRYNDFIAFGFDVKTKDYKVVRVRAYIQEPWDVNDYKVVRVQVYSLRTDSWRFIEDITSLPACPYEQNFMSHGIYLNGSYFVLGLKHFNEEEKEEDVLGMKVILSFDFTQETFTTMQLPNQATNPLTLICLDGKIALMDLADKYDSQINTYNIWVLNESSSGVKESWTRLYSIGPVYRGVNTPRGICRILKNGEFAILSFGFSYGWKFQSFNIVTKEVKDLRTNYGEVIREVIRADVYKESLVPLPISRNGAAADDRVIGGAL